MSNVPLDRSNIGYKPIRNLAQNILAAHSHTPTASPHGPKSVITARLRLPAFQLPQILRVTRVIGCQIITQGTITIFYFGTIFFQNKYFILLKQLKNYSKIKLFRNKFD